MHKKGYFITNYINDLIGCDKPKVTMEAFQFFKELIVNLGLVISEGRLFTPQTCIPCLGINVDIKKGIIYFPGEKFGEIVSVCSSWSHMIKAHKKLLQTLVGSLLYIHKCVRPARLFVTGLWPHLDKPLTTTQSHSLLSFTGIWHGLMPYCLILMAEFILIN